MNMRDYLTLHLDTNYSKGTRLLLLLTFHLYSVNIYHDHMGNIFNSSLNFCNIMCEKFVINVTFITEISS